ncbi:histone PARylation factor 1 isoform X1 [Leptopilina heterotoma]|uniref:histone PARylation factor 1 isoform X1 n=1 Tax=Leptopilina heterotoma TaxID=63436 RepID=UPI001CA7D550|nr:histone PARylation factor 1 isoform X1 [Leptopilina heterotoma]
MSKESDDEEYEKYVKDPRIPCQYGVKCYQKNPMHHNKYKHPPKTGQQKTKKHVKKGGIKRKADEGGSNVKTPPTSPQAKHLDKKQNQNNDDDDDDNEKTQETSLQKIDQVLNDDVSNNRDRLSPSPEKVIDEKVVDKIERKTKILNSTLDDKKRTIKKLFLTEMPMDFYQFYEFCKENSKVDPTLAFKIVNLKLVGPFDIMSEQLSEIQDHDNYLRHWRYFYDPPEFQTILKGNDKDELHFGYWRDDPDKMPVFVAKNNANVSCKIVPVAENLFGVLDSYLEERTKLANPFEKTTIARLHQKLKTFAKEKNITLDKHTSRMKEREKKVQARTFHGAGIVVPFDRKTQVGYRKMATSDADLQKMLKKIEESNGNHSGMTELQEVVRWATIAADECDFGTCLELGHDLFSSGVPQVKDMALQMLTIAYNQLDRSDFLKIAQVHFKDRKKGSSSLSCL